MARYVLHLVEDVVTSCMTDLRCALHLVGDVVTSFMTGPRCVLHLVGGCGYKLHDWYVASGWGCGW